MPSYKLTYFDMRGKAEVSRYLFAKAGVPYEDNRISFGDWGKMKEKTPFGGLPVLEIDGVKLAQSFAIASYLAKTFGLHGKSTLDESRVISICNAMDDITGALAPTRNEKDENRKAEVIKKVKEEKLPTLLKTLNMIIEFHGTGFLVGNEMTLADIYFYHGMGLPKLFGIEVEIPAKLQSLLSKVENDPKIAAWIKSRPQNSF